MLTPEEEKRQEQLRRLRIKSRDRYQQIKAGERSIGDPYICTCKYCGKEFEAKRSDALYCSHNCQVKYYRQQAAEKRSRNCTCENCGKIFSTTRSDKKYCSDECRYEAQIKRKAEQRAEKEKATVPRIGSIEEVNATQDAAEEKIA